MDCREPPVFGRFDQQERAVARARDTALDNPGKREIKPPVGIWNRGEGAANLRSSSDSTL